jgi:hypothetical protein
MFFCTPTPRPAETMILASRTPAACPAATSEISSIRETKSSGTGTGTTMPPS